MSRETSKSKMLITDQSDALGLASGPIYYTD